MGETFCAISEIWSEMLVRCWFLFLWKVLLEEGKVDSIVNWRNNVRQCSSKSLRTIVLLIEKQAVLMLSDGQTDT